MSGHDAASVDKLAPRRPVSQEPKLNASPSVLDNPAPAALEQGIAALVAYRAMLSGDEKGEAQNFLDRLFQAFGHGGVVEAGATLEHRLRTENRAVSFSDLIWKPRVLIEMKKAGEDLARHYQQAFRYWQYAVPNRPRYVVLCNFDEFWIYDFDRQLDEPVDRARLADMSRRWEAFGFLLPAEQAPQFGNDLIAVTKSSAAAMAKVFNGMTDRGVNRETARRFVLQSVMAMFAEDIRLLPSHTFSAALADCTAGASAYDLLFGQFREMNAPGVTAGGRFRGTPYFNGGLYATIEPFDLTASEVRALHSACRTDWSQVRPEIFGTLFEQSMGENERHAFGAHYTSPADIARIVEPCIIRPWTERIDAAWDSIPELERVLYGLSQVKILDPACGCGNFLYTAYREMRRLERRITARIEQRRRGGQSGVYGLSLISSDQFYGMDVNPFAVEIAKVTLMIAKQLSAQELGDHLNVLPLDNLDANLTARDALLQDWPVFDVCIGNPPYLGRRRIIAEHGADYAAAIARAHPQVGGVSDFVTYWFRLAHDRMPPDGRAGLVGTNSIREGDSREAGLDHIVDSGGVITSAVPSLEWQGDAQVHVSIVNWVKRDDGRPKELWLAEGTSLLEVPWINSSLTADIDLRRALPLKVNTTPKTCFQGQTPGHVAGFLVRDPQEAAQLAADDTAGVVRPFVTGDDLNGSGRPERWVIDFAADDAALARRQAPTAFDRLKAVVLPDRQAKADREALANQRVLATNPGARVNWHHRNFLNRWWQQSYRRADFLQRLDDLDRYIGLSRYAVAGRPSIYAFLDTGIRPSDKVVAFTFDDDYSFGVLASATHRIWFERRCTTLGQALAYTNSTVYDTFPWPQAPAAAHVAAIVDAAQALLEHRDDRTQQGIPLSAQYDALRSPGRNPLRDLHARLDAAVRGAYGFAGPDDDIPGLLALNQAVAAAGPADPARPPGPSGLGGTRRTDHRIAAG